jgi:hypothetical protein
MVRTKFPPKKLKHKTGPKGKYQESMIKEIRKLGRFGHTNEEIAEFYEISISTLENYLRDYPDLREALQQGRLLDGMEVVKTLHKTALGYSVTEIDEEYTYHTDKETGEQIKILSKSKTTTKHIQPNITSIIYILKTRYGDKWMDIIKTEGSLNVNFNKTTKSIDMTDYTMDELMMLKRLGMKTLPTNARDN